MEFKISRSDELISGLQDRVLDGVAILAEVFSHTRASGKYREFVRLFEAAFASTFSRLERKLNQFLHPVLEYSRQEIQEWVSLRDPITHADRKKTDLIAFDIDARKIILRMEQAALDVLLNKAEWHNNSKTRRSLWTPPAVTTPKGGIIKQGSKLSLVFQVFDDFGVFPVRLDRKITNIPESWWFKVHRDESEDQSNSANHVQSAEIE